MGIPQFGHDEEEIIAMVRVILMNHGRETFSNLVVKCDIEGRIR